MKYALFVSCPKGLEYLLEEELKSLGLRVTQVSPQGVYGDVDDLAEIYHICLWTRIANRVQLILFSGEAHNEQSLYQLCQIFPWQTVFTVDKTLAIEFHGTSTHIRNTMFGSQVVKDGIVDHFRQFKGLRPTVSRENPQIRLHAHLKHDVVTVSYDLTGYSLHERGYRKEGGKAPIKENVAAAMLIRAKWPQLATKSYALHDPCCGSGTLVIEAAMMAAHIAPGLLRQDQSLIHWAQHQPSLWEKTRALALKQVRPLSEKLIGTDNSPKVITMAQANAARAGVLPLVDFSVLPINQAKAHHKKGLVICNPPYGERLGNTQQVITVYQQLGQAFHYHFRGWHAAVLTSEEALARELGLRSHKQYTLYNGPLKCTLYCLNLEPENRYRPQKK